MTEQRKRHFLIFLPVWIIPVFLITFGSLINFHQNRIWGKQLMPYSYVAPRDKAKIVKIKNQITDFLIYKTDDLTQVNQPEIQVRFATITYESFFRFLMASGLRAPPLV
ncbi:MAG: hypothetical protein D4R67_07690 [Bacteroidetes bacterium]|nr:MAG: hypothetical protein D4R67_07690 [Bacteroidota bacterium]